MRTWTKKLRIVEKSARTEGISSRSMYASLLTTKAAILTAHAIDRPDNVYRHRYPTRAELGKNATRISVAKIDIGSVRVNHCEIVIARVSVESIAKTISS